MFQINTNNFASDALEDAMRLAQTKALNSYTFSDCLSFLNYAWRDIYDRMAMIDDGYYGQNVRLTKAMTKLPPIVKNTMQVYSAQSPVGFDRMIYRESGTTDIMSPGTYKISGNDLYCPDAERRTVWLYFVPACPQVFFTHHNRDPIIHDADYVKAEYNGIYGLFELYGRKQSKDDGGNNIPGEQVYFNSDTTRDDIISVKYWYMRHRRTGKDEDVTAIFTAAPLADEDDGQWAITYISCDFPYIFVTYEHSITGEHLSGFFDSQRRLNIYNPFDFTGRSSDVEYVAVKWNDKTGMGVTVKDYNDMDGGEPRIKELGWTPDTRLNYPAPEMYRYLVARLADKFSALNESNVMGVQKELIEAHYAFEAFISKDKSAFKRVANVNPATIGDWL